VTQLNREGARLAREVADEAGRENAEDCWVAGDIGPFGGFLEPLGETSADQLKEIFVEQLHALRAGGADLALIETMSDPNEASVAVAAAKKVGDWPIVVTFAFQKGGDAFTTMMGSSVEQVVSVAKDAGADAVGANCGTGLSLDDYVQLAEQLVAAAGSTPVIVQPNAGPPRMQGAESVYDAQPSEMAETARRLLAAGVRAVGGCCGTEPRHLAAMADAVREARG
jgi:methionine synthase I (cobalamin-dependent)